MFGENASQQILTHFGWRDSILRHETQVDWFSGLALYDTSPTAASNFLYTLPSWSDYPFPNNAHNAFLSDFNIRSRPTGYILNSEWSLQSRLKGGSKVKYGAIGNSQSTCHTFDRVGKPKHWVRAVCLFLVVVEKKSSAGYAGPMGPWQDRDMRTEQLGRLLFTCQTEDRNFQCRMFWVYHYIYAWQRYG